MKIVLIFLSAIGLVFVLMAVFLLSGWYNVAANEPETGLTRWVLDTVADRSIKNHAEDLRVPDLSKASIETGVRHYSEMCVVCHGAPGVERSEIGKGLNPRPPDLQEEAEEFDERELYWIVKNGIKMSGMPAFGESHSEEELWAIVAFVKKSPELSADEYRALSGPPPSSESPGHEHGETDHHSH